MISATNDNIRFNNDIKSSSTQATINFQANPSSLEQTPPKDTIELNDKKQKLSTGEKWIIGLGLTAVAGIGTRYGLQHKIKNAYKNIKITELPENIIFRKATTKEEALKFMKETLKIKDVESTLTLEELNYINKSLVDVSNAHKGKCIMPSRIKYFDDEILQATEKGKDGICEFGIDCTTFSKDFGSLNINKKIFEPEYLDTELKKLFYKKDGTIKVKPNQVYKYSGNIFGITDKEFSKLLEKYYNNPSSLCLEEKMQLIYSRKIYLNDIYNLERGINIGDAIAAKSGDSKYIKMTLQPEGYPIYHEMGHLQDLLLKKENHISSPILTEINMRRNSLNIFPTKTHKEFLNNSAIQETSGKVSPYAQTAIEEFIAETYAGLLSGRKYTNDVMALYKKYGGPALG